MSSGNHVTYWKRHLAYLALLLLLWFLVSYGCGILLRTWLDRFRLGGFPLGFWFAQNGAIYGFILIIFAYVRLMNRLDRKHGVDER
ncbi:MAG: hypothetical protein RLY31_3087 [Bacteroidota bacterium]|jgi:putative solute:sodium symporter small subunit